MRKIQFDQEQVDQIRDFIQAGHTIQETCNRFTLKEDTLRRVMYEHDIKSFYQNKSRRVRKIDPAAVDLVCNLYRNTNMPLADIVSQVKLEYYMVLDIISEQFSEKFRSDRKSKLYRNSKLGDKNPMKQSTEYDHPRFIGMVDDGQGYLMVKKPEWYTGRRGSDHVFVHSVVMASHLGISEIPKGFVVHHIDGNPHNNDISNLALVSISGHGKWHSMLKNLCKVQRLSKDGVGSDPETPDNG